MCTCIFVHRVQIYHGSLLSGGWLVSPFPSISKSLTRVQELLNIHNTFYQGQYSEVIDFDTTALSSENKVSAQCLKYRAQIASGQSKDVLDKIGKEAKSTPEYGAVKAMAQWGLGRTGEAEQEIDELLESSSENATVQVLGGTILQALGRTEDALGLLSKHQGNLEAYAKNP